MNIASIRRIRKNGLTFLEWANVKLCRELNKQRWTPKSWKKKKKGTEIKSKVNILFVVPNKHYDDAYACFYVWFWMKNVRTSEHTLEFDGFFAVCYIWLTYTCEPFRIINHHRLHAFKILPAFSLSNFFFTLKNIDFFFRLDFSSNFRYGKFESPKSK